MKKEKILRAWRDPEFRESLSEAERAALPAHPSAAIELRDEQLASVRGAVFAIADEIGDLSDTVSTSNTPATGSTCCKCCAVAGDTRGVLIGD